MTRRGAILMGVWAVLTLVGLGWLLAGNLDTEFGVFVTLLVAASLAYLPSRLIAVRRSAREYPVEARLVPLRIGYGITGLITFAPAVAAIFGWVAILPALGSFLLGIILMSLIDALFSDGYQGLWLDALIFHGNLAPPEDDWITKKR